MQTVNKNLQAQPTTNSKRNHIAILWDSSYSRSQTTRNLDMDLVATVLQFLLSKSTNYCIDIYEFRDSVRLVTTVPLKTASSEESIRGCLREVVYDGGTNFTALVDFLKDQDSHPQSDVTLAYLLFSDGLDTFGNGLFDSNDTQPSSQNHLQQTTSTLSIPIYSFASDSAANFTLLKILARKSGGQFYNLSQPTTMSEIQNHVIKLLSNSSTSQTSEITYKGLTISLSGATVPIERDMLEYYPSIPSSLPPSKLMKIAGRFRLNPSDQKQESTSKDPDQSDQQLFPTITLHFGNETTDELYDLDLNRVAVVGRTVDSGFGIVARSYGKGIVLECVCADQHFFSTEQDQRTAVVS